MYTKTNIDQQTNINQYQKNMQLILPTVKLRWTEYIFTFNLKIL